jgi:Copper type II ascorbate-dependent monooxygenase, C-terminal domain
MNLASVIGLWVLVGATAIGCSARAPLPGFATDQGDDTGSSGGVAGGSGSSGGSSGSSSGSGGSSGSSGGATASSSGGSSSGTGADDDGGLQMSTQADSGAAGDNPEIDYTQTKTVTMGTFPVPANSEVFYCQTFANPWGKQVDIKTYDLTMDQGSHHFFAFYQSGASNGAVAQCPTGGLTYGAFTFLSQSPKAVMTFPKTVGATIPAGTGFNMMVHYLNAGTSTLTAHVSLTMYLAKSGVVTNHAGVIFDNNATMTVPASMTNPPTPYVSTQSNTLAQDVYILEASSHMHKFGQSFTATYTQPGGQAQTLYTTMQWEEPPPMVFSSPLHLSAGTTITWSCTDLNTTGSTLTFGEYAQTNVMCISVNIYYPVSDVNNPVLGTAIGGL